MKLPHRNNGIHGEILIELYSIAKFAILESFEPSFYASAYETPKKIYVIKNFPI